MKLESPLTLLAFGDSITAGWGISMDDAFPSLLERRLRNDAWVDIAVRNAGVPGNTTRHGLERLPALLVARPNCAILALGANDALQETPVSRLEANLDQMLRTFAGANIPVLFAGMRAIGVHDPYYAEDFDAVFPRLAEKYGTLFYPFLLEGVSGIPERNQADGLHPNEAGAERIAKGLYPLVLRLIDRCFKA